MKHCLICNASIHPFISFGKMPIANAFLTKDEFSQEYFFELQVAFCENCEMVQLLEQPDREKMFHEKYAFFSSTSIRMAEHFRQFAQFVKKHYLENSSSFVVEMGCNDGILLKNFISNKHIGIEPSDNVAEVAKNKGINTINSFFDESLAKDIVQDYGQADAFLGTNVMCHIPYLHSIAEGIRLLLKPKGVLIFEDPYLLDILEKTSYDQIYDEHAFYFSVASISNLFASHGLELFDVKPQNVHGGSMRYFLGHKGIHPISKNVSNQRIKEKTNGLHTPETYERLRKNIELSRNNLKDLLVNLNKQKKRVVGYAATSKSTTVINYCKLDSHLIEFISDTTPIKQGKYSPGTHIPIKPYEQFSVNYPDYALLFGWNHAEEIMNKEQSFRKNGGKWIVYVPKVDIF